VQPGFRRADHLRLLTALAAVAAVLSAAALAVALTRDDAPALRRVVVARDSDTDATPDKWVDAYCPRGYTPVGGGGSVPHGNDTPGVAIYWSAPFQDNGWQVAAQDTGRRTRPWVLTAVVVCLKPVKDSADASGALPPETVGG
jgi:hypothetical protein